MATHSSILAWRTSMDRGTCQATVHEVTESDTTEQLSTQHTGHLICARHCSRYFKRDSRQELCWQRCREDFWADCAQGQRWTQSHSLETSSIGQKSSRRNFFTLFLSFFYKFVLGVQLIYSVVLISGVQQSESVTCTLILFQILFPYRSLEY